MIKKLLIVLSIMLIMVLFIVSCAPKPTAVPTVPEEKKPTVVAPTPPPAEVPTTGEAPVDEVATDISDAVSVDEELDTSELDDINSILSDIENI